MILQCLLDKIRRWAAPPCEHCEEAVDNSRLERAETLHRISSLAVSREAEKQVHRVSDMRIAASAAVKRLNHEKRVIEERPGSDL